MRTTARLLRVTKQGDKQCQFHSRLIENKVAVTGGGVLCNAIVSTIECGAAAVADLKGRAAQPTRSRRRAAGDRACNALEKELEAANAEIEESRPGFDVINGAGGNH